MRKFKGTVISDKMQKTVVVLVNVLKKHPKYKKYYRVSKKFKAHTENITGNREETYRTGDEVIIEETRPLSRDKRWRVVNLIKRSSEHEADGTQEADKEQHNIN